MCYAFHLLQSLFEVFYLVFVDLKGPVFFIVSIQKYFFALPTQEVSIYIWILFDYFLDGFFGQISPSGEIMRNDRFAQAYFLSKFYLIDAKRIQQRRQSCCFCY